MKTLRSLLLVLFVVGLAALPARAQKLSVNVQYATKMEALHVGIGVGLPMPFAPSLSFVPNAEGYFPDTGTAFGLNGDVQFTPFHDSAFSPFIGAGVGHVFREGTLRFQDPERQPEELDSGLGANLMGGFQVRLSRHAQPFAQVEYRTGAIEDLSFGLGIRGHW